MERINITGTNYFIESWTDDTYVLTYETSSGYWCINGLRQVPAFRSIPEAEVAARLFDVEDHSRNIRNF